MCQALLQVLGILQYIGWWTCIFMTSKSSQIVICTYVIWTLGCRFEVSIGTIRIFMHYLHVGDNWRRDKYEMIWVLDSEVGALSKRGKISTSLETLILKWRVKRNRQDKNHKRDGKKNRRKTGKNCDRVERNGIQRLAVLNLAKKSSQVKPGAQVQILTLSCIS